MILSSYQIIVLFDESTGGFLIRDWIKNCIGEKISENSKRKTDNSHASVGVGKGRAHSDQVCLLSNDERGDRAGSNIELDSSSPSLVIIIVSDNCKINQYHKEQGRLLHYTCQLKSLLESHRVRLWFFKGRNGLISSAAATHLKLVECILY